MPVYLYKAAYSAEAWASLLANPRDISELMRPSIERFGGKVIACFLTVAEAEPGGFIDFPSDAAAAAWGMQLQAQALFREIALLPMMTTQDGLNAMQQAAQGRS